MDLYLYDYDKQFQLYLRRWMRGHRGDYETLDDMERAMPEVYEAWLKTPASWLDGEMPGSFFGKFTDGSLLVRWMLRYSASSVGLPGPLMDRISELRDETGPALLNILRGTCELPERADPDEVKMLAIHLLSEQASLEAKQDYLRFVLSAKDGEDELAEASALALKALGEDAREDLLWALSGASIPARVLLCEALSDMPGDDRIREALIALFREAKGHAAVCAGLLAHYGAEEMLPELARALSDPEIGYIDYLEIRNAVEELGGEVRTERDFSGDPDYESLKEISG